VNNEAIITNITRIREVLDHNPADTPVAVIEKCELISSVLGLSSECKVWAETNYNKRFHQVIVGKEITVTFAAERTKCVNDAAEIEFRLMELTESYFKNLMAQLDYYRSRLSFLGKEYEYHRKN